MDCAYPERARITQRRLAAFVLIFALAAGAGLRLAGARARRSISFDEGISFLAATGHEGAYNEVETGRRPPFGSWVQASEWKKFMRPESIFCFKQIGYDLAHYDVHPPLYFWLLHVWLPACGEGILTAASLNIILSFVTTIVLYGMARYCLRNSLEAAFVALIWALSPAVIEVSLAIRSYDLLALWTVLFVWGTIAWTDKTRRVSPGWLVVLGAVTAAGIMTHYQFLVLILGCVIFSTARLITKDRSRLLAEFGAVAVGCIVFFVFHPRFYLSFQEQQAQARAYRYFTGIPRMERVWVSLMNFFVGNPLLQWLVLAAGIVFISWVVIDRCREKPHVDDSARGVDFTGSYVLFFFIWMAGLIIILYLARVSGPQQMGRRYFTMAYPFLAFVPVLLFRFVRRRRTLVSVCFCICIFLSGCVRVIRFSRTRSGAADPSLLFKDCRSIVVDKVSRGFLPRVLWHVPDDGLILAADRDYLLQHQDVWLPRLGVPGVYISRVAAEDVPGKKELILGLLAERYDVIPVVKERWSLGDAFHINEKR